MNSKANGRSNIYDIINKEKLDVVNKPISKAHGLPNECYNNAEYTKIERKRLFEDKWVVIGVASSIPNPGDAKPFDLLGIPLILLRNKKNYQELSIKGRSFVQEKYDWGNMNQKLRKIFNSRKRLINAENARIFFQTGGN